MYQTIQKRTHTTLKSCIAIAAFVCTVFAGTLTAEVVQSEKAPRGLDPMILSIVDGFESGNLLNANEFAQPHLLKPRAKDKKLRVTISERSRLMVKFADELKVRVSSNGALVSRTNKSIDTVIETIVALELTISPAADVAESKVNALIARAEARTGKQMPDIGGVFWIDGPIASVKVAADLFYMMPEIEWLNAPPIHPSDSPYRGEKLEKRTGRSFNHPTKQNTGNFLPNLSGACMFPEGRCFEQMTQDLCIKSNGRFLGNGSICEQNEDANPRGGPGACCVLIPNLLTNPDPENAFCEDMLVRDDCFDINGVWYGDDGDLCADLAGDCPPEDFNICGSDGDLATYFAGDCYIDQSNQEVEDRIPGAGCIDTTLDGFPNPQEGFIDPNQNCCADIAADVPSCGTEMWNEICASYALSGDYACIRTDFPIPPQCQSPFGPNRNRAFEHQPEMNFVDGCPDIVNPVIENCWPFDPLVPFFTPEIVTPDYFKMGLQSWATKAPNRYENWEVATPNALPELLPWPIGGAIIGETGYILPGAPALLGTTSSAGIETMWDGSGGLDLYPIDPDADQGGMNGGDAFTGLYGYGDLHQVGLEGVNGTYGAGIKVAVLDYAADVQSYVIEYDGLPQIYGAVHEELIDVQVEAPDPGQPQIRIFFDPTAPFIYSRHHGSAVLGIMAADWDTENPDSNTGIRGIAPHAEYTFYPLVGLIESDGGQVHGEGRSATAWINAMISLQPGDVLAATYNPQGGQGGGVNNLDYNAFTHDQITIATALGISVVIGAGMNSTNLLEVTTPSGTDSGAIAIGAVSPGRPFKRYADGSGGSNYVLGSGGAYGNTPGGTGPITKVTASAWGTGVTTCGFGPSGNNWFGYKTIAYPDLCTYNDISGRSYTNNFSGTSAASAIGAGSVIAMQGFSLQVNETPLSPSLVRLYLGGGSYGGAQPTDPDSGDGGDPILNYRQEANLSSENFMTSLSGATWDFTPSDPGTGFLVGNLVDPLASCRDMYVDPIFDTPNINSDVIIISGLDGLGNSNSLAARDSMYFSVTPVHREVGAFYDLPDDYTGPGDHVTYLSTAKVSDIYLSGVFRGGVSPGNIMNWNVVLLDSTYTSTILLLYMWDFSRRDWVQASTSALLSSGNIGDDGKYDVDFVVPRSSRMMDRNGVYHARFVTVTQSGDNGQLYPYFYDQIRVTSGTFPGPIVMP